MPGEAVAVILPVGPEAHFAIPAVWKVGAVLAPIHYSSSHQEILAVLNAVSAVAIVTTSKIARGIEGSLPASFDRKKIFVTDPEHESKFSEFYFRPGEFKSEKVENYNCGKRDPGVVIFSSGSSGKPKGVIQTQFGIMSLVESFRKTTHGSRSSLWPFFTDQLVVTIDFSSYAHTGRLFFLVMGHSRKQMSILHEKFDALSVLNAIRDYRVNFFGGSPVVFEELCHHPQISRYDLSGVQAWCFFAAPMSEEKLVYYERILGKRVCAMYGMSESVQAVTVEPADKRRPGTVGLPVHGVKLKIIDESGSEVAQGETGELCVSRDANALGYLNMPEETSKVFRGEWIHTGDQVRQDRDGYIYIVGRNSSMINQGGVKIIPGEVEATLGNLSGVDACAVVGMPDDLFGQVVGAFIKKSNGADLSEADVIAHCRLSLSDNKIPRKVYFIDEFPRTKTLKIDFPKLLEKAAEIEKSHVTKSNFLSIAETSGNLTKRVTEEVINALSVVLGKSAAGLDHSRPLKEQGMTSLKAVEFSTSLARKIGQSLRSDLAFTFPTVESITAHVVNGILKVPKNERAVGINPKVMNAHFKDILATLDFPNLLIKKQPKGSGTVLLTGATGFFGAHMLDALIERGISKVVCLVRANSEKEATEKMSARLKEYGLNHRSILKKIEFALGDVAAGKFDLTEKDYSDLSQNVSEVYHLAAAVNHLFSYSDLQTSNVGGTLEVLRFAAEGCQKRVHYASTIAVGAKSEISGLDHDRPLRTGYAQSKWVSEKLIKVAQDSGFQINVFRPGQMCWNKSGFANPVQVECLLLKTLAILGKHPPIQSLVEILPNLISIDFAAQAMVAIASITESNNGTYHLINPTPAPWDRIISALKRNGFSLSEVSFDQWIRELEERQSEFVDGTATKILGLLRNDRAMGGYDYQCQVTENKLTSLGLSYPHPEDAVAICTKRLLAGLADANAQVNKAV